MTVGDRRCVLVPSGANLGRQEVQKHLYPMTAEVLRSVAVLQPLMPNILSDGITLAGESPLLMYSFELLNEVLMNRVWVAMLACAALGSSWAMSIADVKKAMPELADMNNRQVIDYLHERYYSDMDKSVLAERLGVKLLLRPFEV